MHAMWRHLFIGTLLCAWLPLAGCRFPWPAQPPAVEYAPSPANQQAYAAATSAYRDGDYAVAAERFSAIREETPDRRMARLSLFGLTCSRFMLAETPEAYLQALELWETWIDNAPDVSHSEDIRLIGPLLQEKMLFSNLPPKAETETEVDSGAGDPTWLFIRTKQELDRLREKLQAAQEADRKHQKRIRSLENEISKLKRQIIALEAIDQKIQEKKTALPATE